MRWFLAFLLLTGVALAQTSQPPTSGDSPSNNAAQEPTKDERGTDKQPLSIGPLSIQAPVTVKIQPADDADEKAAEEKHHREESLKAEKRIAFDTQRLADDTGRLASYTGWLTVFTFLVFVITGFLGAATWRAATAAKVAADIANKAFTEIERPYIYVLAVKGLRIDFEDPDPVDYLTYSVANYGKTPASIELSCAGINVGSEPELPLQMDMRHTLVQSPILAPSERRDDIPECVPSGIKTEPYVDEFSPPGKETVPVLTHQEEFFFWIQIRYRGPFSSGHETSACWRWDRATGSLIQYGGPDYNYTR